MSEEEKKLFEAIKYKNKHLFLVKVDADFLINLVEKQKKELNTLKEIEKSHQEENGKLRVELEQYKLLEANIDKANKIIAENKFDEGLYGLLMKEKEKNKEYEKQLDLDYVDKNYISKNKIMELLENETVDISGFRCIAVEDIENLLEV